MTTASSTASTRRLSLLLNVFGPFLLLAFVILLFLCLLVSESRAAFLSAATFKTVLTQTVIVAIGALGMTMIIVSGGIDLSVGSVVALAGVLGAVLIQNSFHLAAVVLATLATGVAVGFINGALIAGLRMTPFIVTLGMLGIARGSAEWLAQDQTVNFPESAIAKIMADPD